MYKANGNKNHSESSSKMSAFRSFPSALFSDSFQNNIDLYLECSSREDYLVYESMKVWRNSLFHLSCDENIPLFTVEELAASTPRTPFCDLCRSSGWGGQFVTKKKYHFLIPSDRKWRKPLKNDDVLNDDTHVFHGLIHCNGFGHLICINGKEAGSRILCGREIMDLWDRICTSLCVRKITIEDFSKKRGMDMRLLHGIAYGHSWFGRWAYRFHRGRFGLTEIEYNRAVEILSSIQLETIINDFSEIAKIKHLIAYYRNLSEARLLTVRDLLRFILTLRAATYMNQSPSAYSASSSRYSARQTTSHDATMKFLNVASVIGCRWTTDMLEETAHAVVNALKQKKEAMTDSEVKRAVKGRDTRLVDHVLKSMDNAIVGRYLVKRDFNRDTKLYEIIISEIGDSEQGQSQYPDENGSSDISEPCSNSLYSDVQTMYKEVLLDYPWSEDPDYTFQAQAQMALNSEIFVKEWPVKDADDQLLKFICQVMVIPSLQDSKDESTRRFQQQSEVVVVIPHLSTISDLKMAIDMALWDTYCCLEHFVVTEIGGMEGMKDEEIINRAAESTSQVVVKGFGADWSSELTYEAGWEYWKLKCKCGAVDDVDDDGERMVVCDLCDVAFKHKHVFDIDDPEAESELFFCHNCR